ncbi:hypothetical protein NPM09_33045, partial [Bacillus cereus]|nr:hypothetical protein [Bacillus cereus]
MFDLEKRLYQVLRPSLIVYINKLRVENALRGMDTNEEYKYFTKNFFHFKKFYMNFFKILPVLNEKIFTIIENEINYMIWLQGALEKDQKEIHKILIPIFDDNLIELIYCFIPKIIFEMAIVKILEFLNNGYDW